MNKNVKNNNVFNNSIGYKLGKAFGLMKKTMDKRRCGYNFHNLILNMKSSTLTNMSHMFRLFHMSGASTIQKSTELASILEGVKEIPHSLSTEEYGNFWFGYCSNFSSDE
jgi:hypothetical protein